MFGLVAGGLTLALLILFWPAPLGGVVSYVVVRGVSMEPTLHPGELAVMRTQDGYKPGDVVAYRVPEDEFGAGAVIIHRIVGGDAEDGFVVQGDNKEGPDRWIPKPENIVGKMWFHVPDGGDWFAKLREPLGRGAAVGGMGLFLLLGHNLSDDEVRRRRRGGRRMPPEKGTRAGLKFPAPTTVLVAAGLVALVGLALAAVASYSFLQPAQESRLVERPGYEHTASFEYTVKGDKSSLNPSGVIGPISPAAGEGGEVTPPLIYTRLARSMDIGFTYALENSPAADVEGDLTAVLQIQAGEEGWTRTEELLPPTPLEGTTASARIDLDLDRVSSLIETVEEETGFSAGTYDVSVIPIVSISGTVGGATVDETYAPAFTIEFDRTQITPESVLARSDVGTIDEIVSQSNDLGLAGVSISVTTARWIGAGGAALALLAALALAAPALFRLSRDEVARIRARYGSLLISVDQTDGLESARKIQVGSIQDLVRLANRDGRIIMHQEVGAGVHRYLVDDGMVTYEYRATEPAKES